MKKINIDDFRTELGKKIKAIRKSKGLTQNSLAERLDATKSTICKIERGQLTMSLVTLISIANVLEYEVADLVDFRKQN